MRFHSIREEGYFFYWRAWLNNLSLDFLLGQGSFSLKVGRGSRSLKFHIAIPFLFSIWFKIGNILPHGKARELSISYHGGSLWFHFFTCPDDGKYHVIHVVDRLIGKATYSERIIEEREVLIPMPEKSYPATAKLYEAIWTYPRWFKRSIKRVDLTLINEGVPHEGKGENSWDCGVDATFSSCMPANSIAEGVGRFVGNSLKTRIKNGGYDDWLWTKESVSKA